MLQQSHSSINHYKNAQELSLKLLTQYKHQTLAAAKVTRGELCLLLIMDICSPKLCDTQV